MVPFVPLPCPVWGLGWAGPGQMLWGAPLFCHRLRATAGAPWGPPQHHACSRGFQVFVYFGPGRGLDYVMVTEGTGDSGEMEDKGRLCVLSNPSQMGPESAEDAHGGGGGRAAPPTVRDAGRGSCPHSAGVRKVFSGR